MEIENFLASGRYSAQTKERYAWILLNAADQPLASWQAADLIRYITRPNWGKNGSTSTQSLVLHTLKAYIRWKWGAGHPALSARIKKVDPPPQPVLDIQQARDLLASFDPHSASGARDLALCALALDTGLRASELCRLETAYVDMRQRTLKVIVKGGQWKTAVFSEPTANCILKWEAHKRELKFTAPQVFTSLQHQNKGKKLSREGLKIIVRGWGKRLGVRLTPHALRRSFATLATVLGAPTRVVQVAGRWTKIETVERYTMDIQQKQISPYFPAEHLLK